MLILIYLLAGSIAGLIAGLLGVGGGVIVVPVLIMVFEAQGFAPALLTHMAIATSLATIVFTSASSVHQHYQLGGVRGDVLWAMTPGIALGAVLGVLLVVRLDGELVKHLIGGFTIVVAVRMLRQAKTDADRPLPKPALLMVAGTGVGAASTMFGIGGGTFTVPLLSRYRLSMAQVVGTAAACGLPIALVGALTNILAGWSVPGRPEGSIGYIFWPALLGVALASMVFARVGARLAHRVPSTRLKQVFALCLLMVGLRFLLA